MMKNSLPDILKKDGRAMDELAQKRLNQRLPNNPVWSAPAPITKNSVPWLTGIAAALFVGVLISITLWDPVAKQNAQNILKFQGFDQVVESVDKKVKKPLELERQAIIEDIKTLKNRMFSI